MIAAGGHAVASWRAAPSLMKQITTGVVILGCPAAPTYSSGIPGSVSFLQRAYIYMPLGTTGSNSPYMCSESKLGLCGSRNSTAGWQLLRGTGWCTQAAKPLMI